MVDTSRIDKDLEVGERYQVVRNSSTKTPNEVFYGGRDEQERLIFYDPILGGNIGKLAFSGSSGVHNGALLFFNAPKVSVLKFGTLEYEQAIKICKGPERKNLANVTG